MKNYLVGKELIKILEVISSAVSTGFRQTNSDVFMIHCSKYLKIYNMIKSFLRIKDKFVNKKCENKIRA